MPLRLSADISINDRIEARTSLRREIGRTLLITKDTALDAKGANKVRAFAGIADAEQFFGSNSTAEGLKGARVYFAQKPYPKDLLIGRFANTNAPSEIRGGAPGTVAAIEAVSNGSFRLLGTDFANTDFDSDADYAAIAATLQTKLRAQASDPNLSGVTVTYEADPGRFVVSFPLYDDASDLFAPHSVANTGTDVSALLGLTAAAGATFHPGQAAESLAEAISAIRDVDDSFYFVALEPSLADSAESNAASAWAALGRYQFSGLVAAPAALTTGESTSNAALLSATEPERSFLTYSGRSDYTALAAAGAMAGINFSGAGSLLTLKWRKLQGVTPVNIEPAQYNELKRKRINAYSSRGHQSYYGEGYDLKPGVWVDARMFLDWLAETSQNALLSHLTSTPRVPATREGLAQLKNVVAGVCEQGVINGGIAPGEVSEAMAADIRRTTGDASFDGHLHSGFLVWAGRLGSRTPSQVANRAAPAMKAWVHGSAAIHEVELDLTYGE